MERGSIREISWCFAEDGPAPGRSAAEQMGQVMRNPANFACSLHAAAYRVNAFDVRSEDTRRTERAGLPVRLFFTLSPQLVGRFVLRAIDSPSRRMAPGSVSANGELSEDHDMKLCRHPTRKV